MGDNLQANSSERCNAVQRQHNAQWRASHDGGATVVLVMRPIGSSTVLRMRASRRTDSFRPCAADALVQPRSQVLSDEGIIRQMGIGCTDPIYLSRLAWRQGHTRVEAKVVAQETLPLEH